MFVCIHRRNWDCEAMLRSPRSRMWFMLLVCATSSMTSRKRTRERLNLGWQCWKTVRHSWTHPILCTQKCQPEQSLIAIYLIYSIIFAIYLLFSMTWYIFGLINLQIWYIYIYIYIYPCWCDRQIGTSDAVYDPRKRLSSIRTSWRDWSHWFEVV